MKCLCFEYCLIYTQDWEKARAKERERERQRQRQRQRLSQLWQAINPQVLVFRFRSFTTSTGKDTEREKRGERERERIGEKIFSLSPQLKQVGSPANPFRPALVQRHHHGNGYHRRALASGYPEVQLLVLGEILVGFVLRAMVSLACSSRPRATFVRTRLATPGPSSVQKIIIKIKKKPNRHHSGFIAMYA